MLILVHQQTQALIAPRLDPVNVHRGVVGALDDFDLIGSFLAHDITDRHGDTVPLNPEHSRRWARPYPTDATVYLDREDKVRSLINPQSAYNRIIAASLRRSEDKRLITAMLGTALTGETATGTQVLPTSQLVAIGSSPNDVMTLAKIKSASANLDAGGFDDAPGKRIMLYSPGQKSAILAITQAASSDFTARRIYDSGNINGQEWMGFTWIMVPDVKNQGASGISTLERMLPLTSTTRTCVAFATDSVGLSINQELNSFLDILPGKQHLWQARAVIDMGAVRILDGGVVSIAALEE